MSPIGNEPCVHSRDNSASSNAEVVEYEVSIGRVSAAPACMTLRVTAHDPDVPLLYDTACVHPVMFRSRV